MSFNSFRAKCTWFSQISGAVFLVVHAYMRGKFIFSDGNTAGKLLLLSMIAAFLTLVFGILSLPRWQAFVALTISIYAGYWFAYGPLYMIP